MFQEGFQKGQQAGESLAKLQAIADLFYWYRRNGNHLKLFAKTPIGSDVITDEYKGQNCTHKRSSRSPGFQEKERYSEWGNNPRQARLVQNFMFGVGEMIGGIFLVVVVPQSTLILGGGITLFAHGLYTVKDSLSDLWTDHQMEFFELQKITERAEQANK